MSVAYHSSGPRQGQPRGFGFLEYTTSEAAEKAIATVHGRRFMGRQIVVRFSNNEPRSGAQDKNMRNAMASAAAVLRGDNGGNDDGEQRNRTMIQGNPFFDPVQARTGALGAAIAAATAGDGMPGGGSARVTVKETDVSSEQWLGAMRVRKSDRPVGLDAQMFALKSALSSGDE